ncbi:cysteine hydrolase family protein [Bacillus horti]|uniref:Nicotinamidase-related amidase n=1 Tax=Caldalkalibacillus horti TaxID=77523 RepID=A0ABT9VV80_9BACI|nr:cysteine hydrolase family protein [Bacillus horti]MDQ0164902.1 nicotinamidase-related amidase [Bacillus horti]
MSKTALLIVDVQKGMFFEDYPVYQGDRLIKNVQELLLKARAAQAPVIYVQHAEDEDSGPLVFGTTAWEVHDDIAPQDGDVIIHKQTPDSFYQTHLEEELRKQGIEHIVLTGIQTEVCVDTTCRRARSLDYKVTLVTDAHSTWDSQVLKAQQIIDHHNATLRWMATAKKAEEIIF